MAVKALPGWDSDDPSAALAAFVESCKALIVMPADQTLGGAGVAQQFAGQAGQWQQPCAAAEAIDPSDAASARIFFETSFVAYEVAAQALLTGYFEPEYPGAKNFAPGFTVPLYAQPADPELAHLPRAAIDHNALYRKAPVTAYLSNPVDAFMLQIYGAGRILLPDGNTLSVDFDGENHQPYTPIGRILVADGNLAENAVSFESITAWLKSHPREATAAMEQNANYVYLKPLGELAPGEYTPGAFGVPKIPGRSLAVHNALIPLGIPVFVASTGGTYSATLNRLTIAQDTDAGIHGTSAVKLFFGAGPDAEAAADHTHQPANLYLLLPRPAPPS